VPDTLHPTPMPAAAGVADIDMDALSGCFWGTAAFRTTVLL